MKAYVKIAFLGYFIFIYLFPFPCFSGLLVTVTEK